MVGTQPYLNSPVVQLNTLQLTCARAMFSPRSRPPQPQVLLEQAQAQFIFNFYINLRQYIQYSHSSVQPMKRFGQSTYSTTPSSSLQFSSAAFSTISSKSKQNLYVTKEKPPTKDIEQVLAEGENSSDDSHQRLIANLRALQLTDLEDRLENYCVKQFADLPLFMLYEIAKEFNLQVLCQKCQETLINQNYEQLNINKYDLVKLSFPAFQKLLSEYRVHANNLQIYGLKQSDLKTIVDDYCINTGLSEAIKRKLYQEFVENNNFIPSSDDQKIVRRSMIHINKPSLQQTTLESPQRKVKKPESVFTMIERSEQMATTPEGSSSQQSSPTQFLLKKETVLQAQEIRKMIQETHDKQNGLYSQLVGISKECSKNPNKRIIREGLRNIENQIEKLEREMNRQEEKLKEITQNVKGMDKKKSKSAKTEQKGFVFKY